jgi:hypothetical protein
MKISTPLGTFATAIALIAAAAAQEPILRLDRGPDTNQIRIAGDVDGDGVPDLLWGAPLNPEPNPDTRVVSGATGVVLHDVNGPGYHGASNGAGGDLDADGHDDFIVSDAIGLLGTPRAYSGADGSLLFAIPGDVSGYGKALAIVPDIDGDGHDEMAIASPMDQLTFPGGSGVVEIRSGLDGSVLLLIELSAHGGLTAASELAVVGDLDGDGKSELAVGVHEQGPVGAFSLADGSPVLSLSIPSDDGSFGSQVGGLGDVDGDGIPDLYAGGPEDSQWESAVGRVTVFRGSDGAPLWTVEGDVPGDFFASDLDAVGDLDGDGAMELAVGVPGMEYAPPASACPMGHVRVLSGATGVEILRIEGADVGECIGRRVASVRDVNGDSIPDLALATLDEVVVVSLLPPALVAEQTFLSVSAGGAQNLALRAGSGHAGDLYLVLGSASGIVPGFDVAGLHAPLNPDAYFILSAVQAGTPPFLGTLGTLDGGGAGMASLQLPTVGASALVGLSLHHAYGVVDLSTGTLALTSNAVPLVLLP